MRRVLPYTAVLAASLVAAMRMQAQSAPVQNPPAPQQQTPAPKESNPFPEDTTSVPVMPSRGSAPVPESSSGGSDVHLPLPSDNKDPVRSPDDAGPANDSTASDSWSSSQSGLQKILPSDNDDQPEGKRRKLSVPGPEHEETSKEDIDVGKYYLESKNWRAALSRFESALVLAPDEPDVYWGLAESDRHLGNFAEARANYQKVVDYDPDGPHGKAARKALKDPEIANAKAVPPSGPASSEPKQ